MTHQPPLPPLDYRAEDLPDSLQEVCEVIGFKATLALVDQWGGKQLTIPAKITLVHPIVEAIGIDAAIKLSWAYPGIRLSVPACKSMERAAKLRALAVARRSGHTIEDLADMFGWTRRWVEMSLKELRDRHRSSD